MEQQATDIPSTVNGDIDFVRKREGYIYGEGSAAVLEAIRDDLIAAKEENPNFTPERVRTVLYATLRRLATEQGMKPNYEVCSRDTWPCGNKGAYVGWESGPYQWAIHAATIVYTLTGVLAEPHYSFDLCLSEG